MKIDWRAMTRGAVLAYGLTFIGGFILSLSGVPIARNHTAYQLISAYLAITGITISACMPQWDRFKDNLVVANGLWILCSSNVPLGFETFQSWAGSILGYLLYAVVGALI